MLAIAIFFLGFTIMLGAWITESGLRAIATAIHERKRPAE